MSAKPAPKKVAAESTPAAEPADQHLRFVSAASLFDGHDAAINIIRRLLQAHGAEVVHLGHNRSVADIVRAAIQEDADGIAVQLLPGRAQRVLPLHGRHAARAGRRAHPRRRRRRRHDRAARDRGAREPTASRRIYTPDDGRKLGLDGMIEDVFARVRAHASRAPSSGRLRSARSPADRPHDLAARAGRRGGDVRAERKPRAPKTRSTGRRSSASPAPAAPASRA